MLNTWLQKEEKGEVIHSAGGCETEIHFVLVGKKDRKHVRDVKVILRKVQHRLMVVNLDKKVLKKFWERIGS